jgi:hypothetical protein
MPRSVWAGGAIAAVIFATIYLVVSALSDSSIGAAELGIAVIGSLVSGAVGLGIGTLMWRRGQAQRAADR